MGIDKKASSFVRTLSERIRNDESIAREIVNQKKLKKLFKRAVERLQHEKLQKEIQDNFKHYLLQLKSALSVTEVPRPNQLEKKRTQVTCLYSMYATDTTLDLNTVQNSCTDRKSMCRLYLKQMCEQKKSLDQLNELLNHCKIESRHGWTEWMDQADLLCQVTSYTTDLAIVKSIMYGFLNAVTSATEDYIQRQKHKRLKVIRGHTLRILQHFNARYQDLSTKLQEACPYIDLLSCILSAYMDQTVVLARQMTREEVKTERKYLCMVLGQFLRDHVTHFLDVVIQSTALTSQDGPLMLPLIRKYMCPQPVSDHKLYTKYVCAVWKVKDIFTDRVKDITTKAVGISPPQDYMEWLSKANSDIVDEIPITTGFKKFNLSKFFLEEAEEELIEQMVDLLTKTIDKPEDVPTRSPVHPEPELEIKSDADQSPLCFSDKSVQESAPQVKHTVSPLHNIDSTTCTKKLFHKTEKVLKSIQKQAEKLNKGEPDSSSESSSSSESDDENSSATSDENSSAAAGVEDSESSEMEKPKICLPKLSFQLSPEIVIPPFLQEKSDLFQDKFKNTVKNPEKNFPKRGKHEKVVESTEEESSGDLPDLVNRKNAKIETPNTDSDSFYSTQSTFVGTSQFSSNIVEILDINKTCFTKETDTDDSLSFYTASETIDGPLFVIGNNSLSSSVSKIGNTGKSAPACVEGNGSSNRSISKSSSHSCSEDDSDNSNSESETDEDKNSQSTSGSKASVTKSDSKKNQSDRNGQIDSKNRTCKVPSDDHKAKARNKTELMRNIVNNVNNEHMSDSSGTELFSDSELVTTSKLAAEETECKQRASPNNGQNQVSDNKGMLQSSVEDNSRRELQIHTEELNEDQLKSIQALITTPEIKNSNKIQTREGKAQVTNRNNTLNDKESKVVTNNISKQVKSDSSSQNESESCSSENESESCSSENESESGSDLLPIETEFVQHTREKKAREEILNQSNSSSSVSSESGSELCSKYLKSKQFQKEPSIKIPMKIRSEKTNSKNRTCSQNQIKPVRTELIASSSDSESETESNEKLKKHRTVDKSVKRPKVHSKILKRDKSKQIKMDISGNSNSESESDIHKKTLTKMSVTSQSEKLNSERKQNQNSKVVEKRSIRSSSEKELYSKKQEKSIESSKEVENECNRSSASKSDSNENIFTKIPVNSQAKRSRNESNSQKQNQNAKEVEKQSSSSSSNSESELDSENQEKSMKNCVLKPNKSSKEVEKEVKRSNTGSKSDRRENSFTKLPTNSQSEVSTNDSNAQTLNQKLKEVEKQSSSSCNSESETDSEKEEKFTKDRALKPNKTSPKIQKESNSSRTESCTNEKTITKMPVNSQSQRNKTNVKEIQQNLKVDAKGLRGGQSHSSDKLTNQNSKINVEKDPSGASEAEVDKREISIKDSPPKPKVVDKESTGNSEFEAANLDKPIKDIAKLSTAPKRKTTSPKTNETSKQGEQETNSDSLTKEMDSKKCKSAESDKNLNRVDKKSEDINMSQINDSLSTAPNPENDINRSQINLSIGTVPSTVSECESDYNISQYTTDSETEKVRNRRKKPPENSENLKNNETEVLLKSSLQNKTSLIKACKQVTNVSADKRSSSARKMSHNAVGVDHRKEMLEFTVTSKKAKAAKQLNYHMTAASNAGADKTSKSVNEICDNTVGFKKTLEFVMTSKNDKATKELEPQIATANSGNTNVDKHHDIDKNKINNDKCKKSSIKNSAEQEENNKKLEKLSSSGKASQVEKECTSKVLPVNEAMKTNQDVYHRENSIETDIELIIDTDVSFDDKHMDKREIPSHASPTVVLDRIKTGSGREIQNSSTVEGVLNQTKDDKEHNKQSNSKTKSQNMDQKLASIDIICSDNTLDEKDFSINQDLNGQESANNKENGIYNASHSKVKMKLTSQQSSDSSRSDHTDGKAKAKLTADQGSDSGNSKSKMKVKGEKSTVSGSSDSKVKAKLTADQSSDSGNNRNKMKMTGEKSSVGCSSDGKEKAKLTDDHGSDSGSSKNKMKVTGEKSLDSGSSDSKVKPKLTADHSLAKVAAEKSLEGSRSNWKVKANQTAEKCLVSSSSSGSSSDSSSEESDSDTVIENSSENVKVQLIKPDTIESSDKCIDIQNQKGKQNTCTKSNEKPKATGKSTKASNVTKNKVKDDPFEESSDSSVDGASDPCNNDNAPMENVSNGILQNSTAEMADPSFTAVCSPLKGPFRLACRNSQPVKSANKIEHLSDTKDSDKMPKTLPKDTKTFSAGDKISPSVKKVVPLDSDISSDVITGVKTAPSVLSVKKATRLVVENTEILSPQIKGISPRLGNLEQEFSLLKSPPKVSRNLSTNCLRLKGSMIHSNLCSKESEKIADISSSSNISGVSPLTNNKTHGQKGENLKEANNLVSPDVGTKANSRINSTVSPILAGSIKELNSPHAATPDGDPFLMAPHPSQMKHLNESDFLKSPLIQPKSAIKTMSIISPTKDHGLFFSQRNSPFKLRDGPCVFSSDDEDATSLDVPLTPDTSLTQEDTSLTQEDTTFTSPNPPKKRKTTKLKDPTKRRRSSLEAAPKSRKDEDKSRSSENPAINSLKDKHGLRSCGYTELTNSPISDVESIRKSPRRSAGKSSKVCICCVDNSPSKPCNDGRIISSGKHHKKHGHDSKHSKPSENKYKLSRKIVETFTEKITSPTYRKLKLSPISKQEHCDGIDGTPPSKLDTKSEFVNDGAEPSTSSGRKRTYSEHSRWTGVSEGSRFSKRIRDKAVAAANEALNMSLESLPVQSPEEKMHKYMSSRSDSVNPPNKDLLDQVLGSQSRFKKKSDTPTKNKRCQGQPVGRCYSEEEDSQEIPIISSSQRSHKKINSRRQSALRLLVKEAKLGPEPMRKRSRSLSAPARNKRTTTSNSNSPILNVSQERSFSRQNKEPDKTEVKSALELSGTKKTNVKPVKVRNRSRSLSESNSSKKTKRSNNTQSPNLSSSQDPLSTSQRKRTVAKVADKIKKQSPKTPAQNNRVGKMRRKSEPEMLQSDKNLSEYLTQNKDCPSTTKSLRKRMTAVHLGDGDGVTLLKVKKQELESQDGMSNTLIGQKRDPKGHVFSAYDPHQYCVSCRRKKRGTDPCANGQSCNACDVTLIRPKSSVKATKN